MALKIKIEYCGIWNYYPRAAGLADKIKNTLKLETDLIETTGGAFEVYADGKKIHSRLATGMFPVDENIIDLLKNKM